MWQSKVLIYIVLAAFLNSCTRDPEVINNDPAAPQVELDIISRISAELSIVSTVESSDITYGGEIIQIVDGEESGAKISFTTKELDENHRYSWVTENLQPNSIYIARTFITNGQSRKYSSGKTYSTPSTSKPTLSAVTLEGESLVASILDNGGRALDDVGFVVGDTPNRKELMRKAKTPADKQTENHFSLSIMTLHGGKTYYAIAYAIDEQENVAYSSTPLEVFVPQSVESVTLNMKEAELPVNGTITLTATISPKAASVKTVTWESLDPEIATVGEGVVTGVKAGKTSIVATVDDVSTSCEVTVKDISISFLTSEAEVYVGETFTIEATVSPESFTDIPLTWESSNPSVALITEDGVVTPVGVGESTITASAYGLSASFKCTVVSEAPVFPDEAFREYVYSNFDTNHDGFLTRQEVLAISRIDVGWRSDISSLTGIEYMENLVQIQCSESENITELNVYNCPKLESLWCNNTKISSLDVTMCPNLSDLYFGGTQVSSIDLSNCPLIKKLWFPVTQISYLDVSVFPLLETLACSSTQISTLDVSNCSKLKVLYCSDTKVSSIDVSNCPLLEQLQCSETQISSLDVSNCPLLLSLGCNDTLISSLDVSNCTELQSITCHNTQLSSLDVTNCTKLRTLWCQFTQIPSLDVSNCIQLQSLLCYSTKITSLNVTNCTKLRTLLCQSTQISSLDVSNCTQLEELSCGSAKITSLVVANCMNLKYLSCDGSQITSLDISNCSELEKLMCSGTLLSSLEITNCPHLKLLDCYDTLITILDVSNCSQLIHIECGDTPISSLDVSNCLQLEYLSCYKTSIKSLDLRNCGSLRTIYCKGCPNLTDIWLIAGHEYDVLSYDQDVATLHYE